MQALPILQLPVGNFAGEPLYVYKLLQYVSTVVGGIIVLGWLGYRLWQGEARATPSTTTYSPIYLASMLILSMLTGFIYGAGVFHQQGWRHAVVQTVVTSMSMFAGLLGVFSIIWYILGNRVRHTKP